MSDTGRLESDLLSRIGPHIIRDSLLDEQTRCELLAFAHDNASQFRSALLGEQISNLNYRRAMLMPRARFLAWRDRLLPIFRAAAVELSAQFSLPASSIADFEMNLARHNHGDFYRAHRDTRGLGIEPSQGRRLLSMVYYFYEKPKGFGGGELRLFSFDNTSFTDVEPRNNRVVAFLPWMMHEVRPINCPSREPRSSRFAVNCWALEAPGSQ